MRQYMMAYRNPDYIMSDRYAEKETIPEEEQKVVPDDSELEILNQRTISREILRKLKRGHPH